MQIINWKFAVWEGWYAWSNLNVSMGIHYSYLFIFQVNFANPVYNSLFLEGPSRDDYAEVNRQLIFEDGDNKVDFSNPMYDSYYGSNDDSELDLFLPRKQSPDAVSSNESYGSHDSLRGSTTRLVKNDDDEWIVLTETFLIWSTGKR